MLNVTDATKNAYYDDTLLKTLIITFPNKNVTFTGDDILGESVNLIEKIETERSLTFKGCIASKFTFKVADNVIDLRGEYLEATIQADDTEEIPLFSGYVDTQDNMTHEDIITEFTCYDPLYKIGSRNMQSWVDSRSYPITVRNFRNQLFSNLGITQESKTLINDSLTISENLKSFMDAPSAVDLMRWICQLNAVYGQYGRDGQFKYRELKALSEGLYPSETTYPGATTYPAAENAGIFIDTSDYITLQYEPYNTDYVTKVAIMDVNGIDQGQAGTEGNTLVIQDNPIAFNVNSMRSAARAILAKLDGINHIPVVSMKCVGLPYAECGDTYVSYTKRFACRTYIFQRTLTGIQALFDEYSSDSDKDLPPYKSTSTTRINAERQTVMDIQADIVEMNEVIATKATIEQLEAVDGKFKNLDADNITTGTIKAGRFGKNSIGVEKLSGSIEGNDGLGLTDWEINLTNGTMTIGEINANKIKAGTISANRIGANSIGVSKLTGSISNGSWKIDLDNGTMSIGTLAVGSITGNITGGDHESWKVDFDNGEIDIGTLSVSYIKGSIQKADYQGASNWVIDFDNGSMTIGDINADHIKAGTIQADRIEAGSIVADKLNVSMGGSGADQNSWGINLRPSSLGGSSFSIGTIGSNRTTASTVNGHATSWQNINVVYSSSYTYLWQLSSTKEVQIADSQPSPDPNWHRIGSIPVVVTKKIYVMAQDNST